MNPDESLTGWRDYEQLVTGLVGDLAQELHGENCRVERQRPIPGASGFDHHIDVSVQSARHLYIAECKHWNKSVPAEVVLAFLGRMVDIRANPDFDGLKVIAAVCTTKDFQAGCKQIGDRWDIELDVVRNRREFTVRYLDHVKAAMQDISIASDDVQYTVE